MYERMSAPNNNTSDWSSIPEALRPDVTVKVRKQGPATESLWGLITAVGAASTVCVL